MLIGIGMMSGLFGRKWEKEANGWTQTQDSLLQIEREDVEMAGLRVCIVFGKTLTQVTPNRMCVTMVRELLTEAKRNEGRKEGPTEI